MRGETEVESPIIAGLIAGLEAEDVRVGRVVAHPGGMVLKPFRIAQARVSNGVVRVVAQLVTIEINRNAAVLACVATAPLYISEGRRPR